MAATLRTDTDIQRDVLEELDWDPEVDSTEIGVEVDEGVVTLTGTVTTYAKRYAAERAALRVAGVRAVANEIVVKERGARTDTDIAKAVANALENDARVPAERIHIIVRGGKVTLQGEVDHAFQRDAALEDARRVSGVVDVIDQITVRPAAVSPEDVKAGIERAFLRSAMLDAERVKVHVEDHHVILTGVVRSAAEKREAEAAAWRAPGVMKVTNELHIEPGE